MKFLNQPYPLDGRFPRYLIRNGLIGAFIAFFLIIFQPFGTDDWHSPHKMLILMGYGVITFLASSLVHLFLFGFFKTEQLEKDWTVGWEILINLGILGIIAGGNMLYGSFIGITTLSVGAFFTWLCITMLVGIFPLFAGVLIRHNLYLALNRRAAAIVEARLQQPAPPAVSMAAMLLLRLTAENEKETLTFDAAELLYLESADNYAEVVRLKNGKLQKTLLRGPLKRFESQMAGFPQIVRCHRSFIVNLDWVEHVDGNAQGYRLTLRPPELSIPVARNYGATVLAKIRN